MCDEFVDKIAKMLENLSINDSRETALDSLNQLFVTFNEEVQLMGEEERAAQHGRCIEAQRVFHNAGLRIIAQLPNQQEQQPEQNEMVVDEQKDEGESASTKSGGASVAASQADDQKSHSNSSEDDATWGSDVWNEPMATGNAATGQEHNTEPSTSAVQAKQQVELPFLDFENLFRPLFEIQQMSRVDELCLSRFLATLEEMREQAERLHFPIEQERQFIIALIQNRLDYVSRSLWMWQLDRKEPTLELLTNFLIKRCGRIEAHERQLHQVPAQNVSPRPPQGAVPRTSAASRAAVAEQPSTSKGKKHKPVCVECGGEHYLHKCDRFKEMSMVQKRAFLDHLRMCHNCFSSSHLTGQCKQGGCKRCGTKHNSLLCPDTNRK